MIDALMGLDGGFLLWIQETLRQDWLDPVVSLYTKLGDGGMAWILLCVILLAIPKTRKAGAAGAVALLLSLLCTNVVLKHLFTRTRPWLVVEGLIPLVHEPDPNSFPSGHTSAAFSAAVAWWGTLPQRWARGVLLGAAILMGLSRLYVGVHFPSDVLAGAAVGCFCGWAAGVLCERSGLSGRLEAEG